MSTLVNTVLDLGGANRLTNLAASVAAGQPVIHEQLQAAIEGLAWKDGVRVASTANLTIASPGASIDAISLTAGDRVLVKNQTTGAENGIYVWNGAAVPLTRALDASTFLELEAAVVTVEEGTAGIGTTWRQSAVNGTIGSTSVVWGAFGTSAPPATETTSGTLEIATQAETDTGTDDARAITPLKLKTSSLLLKKYAADIGDAATTSIAVTHNLNTLDVQGYVYEKGGSKREVFCEKQHTSTTVMTFVFDTAPALNAYRVVIQG